jgi:hypothetical protein
MISCIFFSSKKRDFEAENELNQAHFVGSSLRWCAWSSSLGDFLISKRVFYAGFSVREKVFCVLASVLVGIITRMEVFFEDPARFSVK